MTHNTPEEDNAHLGQVATEELPRRYPLRDRVPQNALYAQLKNVRNLICRLWKMQWILKVGQA